jgi:hypothetical protein
LGLPIERRVYEKRSKQACTSAGGSTGRASNFSCYGILIISVNAASVSKSIVFFR